ncbi:hypothetical protein [Streptomyces sp. TLI_171]|uniref:hypothetical protein n=1 Tax=Streptomyces sp. TLI_171 TaxID=1938859 RepID=UPI000C1893D1|nr:hypothetical protein [Streptomyces sp. TLI_171]RKE02878.1 hypothetical protein BX266_7480 [Streptomyces sp. TLI_171]
MLLPHPVLDSLTPEQSAAWHEHFAPEPGGRRPSIEEGIWRRTQDPRNAEQSGWSEDESGRRRVVHYRLHYDLDQTQPMDRLVMAELYLAVSWLAPAAEVAAHRLDLEQWLAEGRWKAGDDTDPRWRRGDLYATITEHDVHPQDERAGRDTPPGFRSIDVTIHSIDYALPRASRNLPWDVLAGGMRVKEQRGTPQYAADLSGLLDHLPFVVEAGCGTSIEAGVQPLHWLHEVYRVTERKGNDLTQGYRFTMAPGQDTLVQELLTDTERKVDDMVAMFRALFQAEPTDAHRILKALYDAGHAVGQIATHNFDRLFARAGIPEAFMRRYDQRTPHMHYPAGARSLLVIGLHADRRAVQARARKLGLKVFYLDTEGVTENGIHKEYLIEGAREGDVIVRSEAITALRRLAELLEVEC